jgi:hypothetical protein
VRWPTALAAVNEALNGAYIAINLADIQRQEIIFTTHSPWDADMIRRVDNYRYEIPGSLETFLGPLEKGAGLYL